MILLAASVVVGLRANSRRLPVAPALIVESAPYSIEADTLRAGETVSQLFARQGVNDVDWSALARAVRNFDPSRLRSGTVFNFTRKYP